MKAIITSPESLNSVQDIAQPTCPENGALVRTIGSGVCGTDLLKINLKLLQKPTVLGHEWVGEIIELGPKTQTAFKVGDQIVAAHHVPCFECHYCKHGNVSMCSHFKTSNFVPGGFAEIVALSQEHLSHTSFLIPKGEPWQKFTFTEPLACCVRNIDRLPLLKNDTVVIVGLGSIGLLMTKVLQHYGIKIIGVDIDPLRTEEAQKNWGLDFGFTAYDEGFHSCLAELTENRGADGVIFTAGPAKLLNESLNWVRSSGFVNLFSHLSGEMAEVDTAKLYHQEIQIITTYSASPESLKKSYDLILENPDWNLEKLYASPYSPESFNQAISDVNERKVLKALIKFQ